MCAQFHPSEDLVVSASLDQTVRVWDISGESLGLMDARTTGWVVEELKGMGGWWGGSRKYDWSCISASSSSMYLGQICVGSLQKHLSCDNLYSVVLSVEIRHCKLMSRDQEGFFCAFAWALFNPWTLFNSFIGVYASVCERLSWFNMVYNFQFYMHIFHLACGKAFMREAF